MKFDPVHTHTIIRRLWQSDKSALVRFFQQLDQPTRRLRFCSLVSDDFLKTYAEGLLSKDTITFGAFSDQQLHGIAELRIISDGWPRTAEGALLVEPAWREMGLGDSLFDRIITASQNRYIKSISLFCLRENKRMQHLAAKHDAVLKFDVGDAEAVLTLPWPTPITLFDETFADTRGYIQMMLR